MNDTDDPGTAKLWYALNFVVEGYCNCPNNEGGYGVWTIVDDNDIDTPACRGHFTRFRLQAP